MKPILSIICLLMLTGAIQAQKKPAPKQSAPRTIKAAFANHGKVSGDTAWFEYQGNMQRYFNRHVRVTINEFDNVETGSCILYLLVDTAGAITKSWCDQVTNELVSKDVMRVVSKMSKLTPTRIKAKPVTTQVSISFGVYYFEDTALKTAKEDIIAVGYGVMHKKEVK